MKLKLKVSKTLKKSLKIKAEANELERNNYVIGLLQTLVDENKSLWVDQVEAYPELVAERQQGLEALKESFTEEISINEQRAQLKAYYTENHLYINIYSTKKKFENLMLPLEDNVYYALCILGEADKLSVEHFVIAHLSKNL
jgi:predicted HicB family RNase H-like nuclease